MAMQAGRNETSRLKRVKRMLDVETRALMTKLQDWKAEDDAHEFLFTRDEWHLSAEELVVQHMALDRSFHFYSLYDDGLPVEISQRRPVANWYAGRDGYLELGIRLISLVLSDITCLTINLEHEESRIKQVHFCKRAPIHASPQLTYEPVRFRSYLYIPQSIERYDFACSDATQSELINQNLLVSSLIWTDQTQRYEQTSMPDGLFISATPQRMADLGAFLIDFGRKENEVDEYAMESALDGAGGVSHGSVEQKFWLPGSLAFPQTGMDTLSLS